MKKAFIKISVIVFFFIFPVLLNNNFVKAGGYVNNDQSVEELREGTVIDVKLGILGLHFAIVQDEETGNIYVSQLSMLDFEEGDVVTYSITERGSIIIRQITR